MRVIAGTARSLPLKTPTGMDTRPTTDRIKETLFNVIQNEVPGAAFIDMFSGSGGIGIEALSRGARKCYFLENDKEALNCIRDNLKFTKFEDRAVILSQDAFLSLNNIFEKEIDVIFMDPPYRQELEKQALQILKSMKYVTPDTLIIVEASKETDFAYLDEMGYDLVKEKVYKTNKHLFIRKKA
mgnify:FL=1